MKLRVATRNPHKLDEILEAFEEFLRLDEAKYAGACECLRCMRSQGATFDSIHGNSHWLTRKASVRYLFGAVRHFACSMP
ncbi:MAG: hypothetical protein O3B24_06655 [Verrucomicrobia bacterium]|nr:hypothetical protein [Verrucomicrobiota bacterium]